MKWARALRRECRRVMGAVTGHRREQELADEIASHIEMQAADNRRLGMTAEEARRAAILKFGGVESAKESYRDQRGLPFLDAFLQDVRYGLRGMRQSPGFTAVALAILALGIGANTAIFSVVEAVILRPLPYPQPQRLVSVYEVVQGLEPAEVNSSGGNLGTSSEPDRTTMSIADLNDFRRDNRVFQGIAGIDRWAANLTGQGAPERVWGERVTANYFSVLGVQPALGRAFLDADDRPGAAPVVILTHDFWKERFGGGRNILGGVILLDEQPYRVIGIMPEAYQAPAQFASADKLRFLVPAAYAAEKQAAHGDHDVMAIARLKAGVTVEQARADLDAISRRLAAVYPKTNSTIRAAVRPLSEDIAAGVRTPLLILMAAAGIVLLIACANLANLSLVRALGRRKEIVVRFALGAGRARVMAGLITQSALLAACGGVAGVLAGIWARRVLVIEAPPNIPRLDAAGLNAPALWFAVALSCGTGLFFGLLPAWQISRVHLADSLRAGERGMAVPSVMRWRTALMMVQVALSMVLLVGAGLLIRSLIAWNLVDLGFRTEHVLAARLDLPQAKYGEPGRRLRFFQELTARVHALPGVEVAAFANRMPLRGGWNGSFFLDTKDGVQGHDNPSPGFQLVSPDYFRAFDIPVMRGRVFTEQDRDGAPGVAVVNTAFVRAFVNGADPVGLRIRGRDTDPWQTIVGVVGDIRRAGPDQMPQPQVYLAAAQTSHHAPNLADFAFRVRRDPKSLLSGLQREVWAIDPDQPLTNVRTMDEILRSDAAARRFQMLLLTMFAVLALVLTLVGIYGVIGYAVSQRTAEIGIRVALGATPRHVLGLILGRALALVALGVTGGGLAALGAARSAEKLLFAIQPADPTTYASIAFLLLLAAALACYLPARRALRLDASRALRYE